METNLRRLIHKGGVAMAAHALHRRYASVRAEAVELGIEIRRGRPVDPSLKARDKQIRLLRKRDKKFLHQIGDQFQIKRERVRQILSKTGGDPLKGK